MAFICPQCGKILQERKEMQPDAMGTRGMRRYLYCSLCNTEVKNPILKEVKMR